VESPLTKQEEKRTRRMERIHSFIRLVMTILRMITTSTVAEDIMKEKILGALLVVFIQENVSSAFSPHL